MKQQQINIKQAIAQVRASKQWCTCGSRKKEVQKQKTNGGPKGKKGGWYIGNKGTKRKMLETESSKKSVKTNEWPKCGKATK